MQYDLIKDIHDQRKQNSTTEVFKDNFVDFMTEFDYLRFNDKK